MAIARGDQALRISVVVPAYNEERYLADCLASLMRHTRPELAEIIVVDNASTDATGDIARSFPGVSVVREETKGLLFARQRGLEVARGDVLACVDADSRVPASWFDTLIHAFRADPNLVCLSGPYTYFDLPRWQQMAVSSFWAVLAAPAYACTGYMAVGGNFAARRSALLAIGGFDTSIRFYGEDTDIARRLSTQGTVRFSNAFRVHSSARRLQSEGLVRTGITYAANFLWEALFHRPLTSEYTDVR